MEERTLEKTCKKAQEEKNAEVSKIKKALAEAAAKKKALEQIDDDMRHLGALLERHQDKSPPTDLGSPAPPHSADGSYAGPSPEYQWPSNKRKRYVTTPSPQKKKKHLRPVISPTPTGLKGLKLRQKRREARRALETAGPETVAPTVAIAQQATIAADENIVSVAEWLKKKTASPAPASSVRKSKRQPQPSQRVRDAPSPKRPAKLVQQLKKAEKSARDKHDQKLVDEMRALTAGSSSVGTSSARITIDDDDEDDELSEAEPEWIENLGFSENDDDEIEIDDDED